MEGGKLVFDLFKEQGLACSKAVSDVLTLSIGIPFSIAIVKTLKMKEKETADAAAAKSGDGGEAS